LFNELKAYVIKDRYRESFDVNRTYNMLYKHRSRRLQQYSPMPEEAPVISIEVVMINIIFNATQQIEGSRDDQKI